MMDLNFAARFVEEILHLDKRKPRDYACVVFNKAQFTSLRLKVVFIVALPMFFTLAGLSYYQYYREQQVLLKQLDDIAYNFGEAIAGGLRHIMLNRDQSMMSTALSEISAQSSILHIALYNSKSELIATNDPGYFDITPDRLSPGCVECHEKKNYQDFRSLVIRTLGRDDALRTSVPIRNEVECYSCHAENEDVLGVLVIDFSLESLDSRISGGITLNLILSIVVTLFVSLAVYYWIETIVIGRLKLFEGPIHQFSDRDFSARVEVDRSGEDEITRLQKGINQMAVELERQLEIEHKAINARFQAIIEERKRLSRELHDSTAQILGYVTTKAAAVRLFVEKGNREEAVIELNQLEAAARSVFADLRQAIMDLNTIPDEDWDIVFVLRTYVNSFERYSQISATIVVESVDGLKLPPESYLQVLRIVQEALANVRKHSRASKVDVRIAVESHSVLEIIIKDNGVGFDTHAADRDSRVHFGLNSMEERAQSIGANLSVLSEPGKGAEVRLVIPLVRTEGDI